MFDVFVERALCCFNKVGPEKPEKPIEANIGYQQPAIEINSAASLNISELDKTQVDAAFPRFVVCEQ